MGIKKVFYNAKRVCIKLKKNGKTLQTKKKTGKIRTTLILSFMVPVILIVTLGLISYKQSSQAIMERCVESADSTMVAMDNYITLLCDNFINKTTEMLVNENFSDYYQKYYNNDSAEGIAIYNRADKQMGLIQIATPYLKNYYFMAEKGNAMLSAPYSSSFPKNAYALFWESDGAAYMVDKKVTSAEWIGYHDFMDKGLEIDKSSYAFSLMIPFMNSKNSGILLWDMDKSCIDKALMSMDFGEDTIKGIVTQDGRENLVIDKVEKTTGKIVPTVMEDGTNVFFGENYYNKSVKTGKSGYKEITYEGKDYLYVYTPIGETKMMMCALIPKASILKNANSIRNMTMILVIVAALIALLLGIGISTGISKVLNSICRALEKVAAGKLNEKFETKRKDEFRLLTDGMTGMLSGICGLMKNISIFGNRVMESTDSVSKTSDEILVSMECISRNIDEIAGGVTSQAEDTERCATQMLEFSEKINNVYCDTEKMGMIADDTRKAVDAGKIIVGELSEKSQASTKITKVLVAEINEVQKQSESIVDIIGLINTIASQTNLLSLNASIEAARAGEYGKGFAVVAEEIRKLADQSVQAGNKVNEVVNGINLTTQKTTDAAKQTEKFLISQNESLMRTIEVFRNINNQVNTLVEDIMNVQRNMTMMMDGKEKILGSIQNVSAVSQEITASTQEVNSTLAEQLCVIQKLVEEAEHLNEEVVILKENMSTFILD